MNSCQYVRHNEQLQQLLRDRFLDFDKDRELFKTFAATFWSITYR